MNDQPTRAGRPTNARIQSSVREPAREPVRDSTNRTEGTRLARNRKRSEDKFYVDPRIIPAGRDYQWVRMSCYGQPDPDHVNNLKDNHWTEVPQDRHSGLVVEKDGMRLMERPMYLSEEARQEDYDLAISQVRSVGANVTDAPKGHFRRAAARVNSDFQQVSLEGTSMAEIADE